MSDVRPMLQALGDPIRFEIFECLRACGGGSAFDTKSGTCGPGEEGCRTACDIQCEIDCSPSQMSRHFATLREVGLVHTERHGRKLYARLNSEAVRRLQAYFSNPSGNECCP